MRYFAKLPTYYLEINGKLVISSEEMIDVAFEGWSLTEKDNSWPIAIRLDHDIQWYYWTDRVI